MQDLDDNDLTLLIEALEAWVNKDDFGNALGGLVGSVFMKDDPKFMAQQEESKAKHEEEKKLRKERAILLQAKLISLKDSATARSFSGAA